MARTYSLVKVDGVLARDNVGDGGALGLAGLLGGRHLCEYVRIAMTVWAFVEDVDVLLEGGREVVD